MRSHHEEPPSRATLRSHQEEPPGSVYTRHIVNAPKYISLCANQSCLTAGSVIPHRSKRSIHCDRDRVSHPEPPGVAPTWHHLYYTYREILNALKTKGRCKDIPLCAPPPPLSPGGGQSIMFDS